jgi:hypothetical protein
MSSIRIFYGKLLQLYQLSLNIARLNTKNPGNFKDRWNLPFHWNLQFQVSVETRQNESKRDNVGHELNKQEFCN